MFFSPQAFVWVHAYPEAIVAEALQSEGIELHYVTCGRALSSWCVSMESTGEGEQMPESRKAWVCGDCEANKRLILDKFDFESSELSAYITDDDLSAVEQHIEAITPQTLSEFVIDGVKVGVASMYNFTLNRKKHFDNNFTDEEWGSFLKHFRSCLVSFYAGRRLLDKHSPDYLFFYTSAYSINLVVRLQAEQRGIRCFSIAAGANWHHRLQRIFVSRTDSFHLVQGRVRCWDETYAKKTATKQGLSDLYAFQKSLLAGSSNFIYGGGNSRISPQELRERFDIDRGSKVLFVATSSYDELLAAQSIERLPADPIMAFETQIDWLKGTIDYVRDKPDMTLIIRVHPREFPNRRESRGSEHSKLLKAELQNLPANVKVNWPEDQLSMYDWLEMIDVGISSWSSAGKEIALWGIPIVSYTDDIGFYPKRELGFVGETPGEYYAAIEAALEAGWSAERLEQAYRWCAYELEGSVFDLSDVVPRDFGEPSSGFDRVLDKLTKRTYTKRRLLKGKSATAKAAPLIAEKVTNNLPTVDVLEPTVVRMSPGDESAYLREIVGGLADVRFGEGWRDESSLSPLRQNLVAYIAGQV